MASVGELPPRIKGVVFAAAINDPSSNALRIGFEVFVELVLEMAEVPHVQFPGRPLLICGTHRLACASLDILQEVWPPQILSSVYLRNTFAPRRFYHMPLFGDPDTYIFVLENKGLAGREFRDGTDAQVRPLVVCFFRPDHDAAADQLVMTRLDTGVSCMTTMDMTPAELRCA